MKTFNQIAYSGLPYERKMGGGGGSAVVAAPAVSGSNIIELQAGEIIKKGHCVQFYESTNPDPELSHLGVRAWQARYASDGGMLDAFTSTYKILGIATNDVLVGEKVKVQTSGIADYADWTEAYGQLDLEAGALVFFGLNRILTNPGIVESRSYIKHLIDFTSRKDNYGYPFNEIPFGRSVHVLGVAVTATSFLMNIHDFVVPNIIYRMRY